MSDVWMKGETRYERRVSRLVERQSRGEIKCMGTDRKLRGGVDLKRKGGSDGQQVCLFCKCVGTCIGGDYERSLSRPGACTSPVRCPYATNSTSYLVEALFGRSRHLSVRPLLVLHDDARAQDVAAVKTATPRFCATAMRQATERI